MATHQIFIFLVLLISSSLTMISMDSPSSTTPHTSIKPQKPPSYKQIQNIVEALMATEDFSNWAVVLSTTDPSTFPLTATLFIPRDSALSNFTSSQFLQFDPSTFAYHIIPQQITFSLLKTFKIGSRIPTLLPKNSILVTNGSESNFTIDDSKITDPDLYINGAIAVHGIESLLNYSVFGGGFLEDHQNSSNQSSPDESSSSSPEGIVTDSKKNPPIIGNLNDDQNMGLRKSDGDRKRCNITPPDRTGIIICLIIFAYVLYLNNWPVLLLFALFIWMVHYERPKWS